MASESYKSKDLIANMAYSHCKTRILDLTTLNLPADTSEQDYKDIYSQLSASKTPEAQSLVDAITSVSIGLAPPVAFPTETVYGLGADATNSSAIAGIFAAKGRPSDNPLIVHVASREHLERLTGEPIPEVYHDLVAEYWPGPLTILVPVPQNNSAFAANVHPGQNTIGFRVPSSNYARFFIAATDKPIAAPSANSSGKPSPTTAQHVLDDLDGKINFILDGGSCDVGLESTVVDGLHDPPLILRPGGISRHDLIRHGNQHGSPWSRTALGYKEAKHPMTHAANTNGAIDAPQDEADEAPRAPGMKYKHYAPSGKMILLAGDSDATFTQLAAYLAELQPTNNIPLNIGILTTTIWSQPGKSEALTAIASKSTRRGATTTTLHLIPLGTTPRLMAQNLFAALRECDRLSCTTIFAELPHDSRTGLDHSDTVSPTLEIEPSRESSCSTGSQVEVTEQKHNQDGEKQEASTEEDDHDHVYDAIVERMRKAASEVVHCRSSAGSNGES